MYTQLPTTEEEFETMVSEIFEGYATMPTTDELVLRMRIDINYLLHESGLEIWDDEEDMRIAAYSVKRNPKGSDRIEILPVWTAV